MLLTTHLFPSLAASMIGNNRTNGEAEGEHVPRDELIGAASMMERMAPPLFEDPRTMGHRAPAPRPTIPDSNDSLPPLTVGMIGGGLSLMTEAWRRAEWVFQTEATDLEDLRRIRRERGIPGPRTLCQSLKPSMFLGDQPIRLLIADHLRERPSNGEEPGWVPTLRELPESNRPAVILQLWPAHYSVATGGPLGKRLRKSISQLGYQSESQLIDNTEVGGVVSMKVLAVWSARVEMGTEWSYQIAPSPLGTRPMSNCLRPYGAGRIYDRPTSGRGTIPSSGLSTGQGPNQRDSGRRVGNGTDPGDPTARATIHEQTQALLRNGQKAVSTDQTDSFYVGDGSDPWEDTISGTAMENKLFPPGGNKGISTPVNKTIPQSLKDPMPNQVGSWIQVDGGFRRLNADELAKGLGMPGHWVKDRRIPKKWVENTPSAHLYEALGQALPAPSGKPIQTETQSSMSSPLSTGQDKEASNKPTTGAPTHEWSWNPPDLKYGRRWYKRRLRNLKKAADCYPSPQRKTIVEQGQKDLIRHRENYGPDGAKYLQILWWEFPKEQWEDLRLGSSMNFMTQPPAALHANDLPDANQVATAVEFMDELIELGALEESPADDPLVASAPLFCVPKPGQPGQWRIIADMKRGGQNSHMGKDPVFLPRSDIILGAMYRGGWSATVDASKFFYQFPTKVSERKFLGVIHPTTGIHYRYRGLPMGSANSPAAACRLGAAFIRKLLATYPEFQGEPYLNTKKTQAKGQPYHEGWGHGRVLIDESDGLPAVLIWAHVDDFLIHGPTKEKTDAALSRFMDGAITAGLLCNPIKTEPPTQCVKYCGFLYDTTDIPTLRVPEDKRTRALAMVNFALGRNNKSIEALSLAVIVGVLQSLVGATPARLGQTYLREGYSLIHAGQTEGKTNYYRHLNMTEGLLMDLDWWKIALRHKISRRARPLHSQTLVSTYGDGSGTGTGGTIQVHHDDRPDEPMDMWMGVWKGWVHHFSSNWRELHTLLLTLERALEKPGGNFRETVLMYFTDNLVTYYIVNSGSSTNPALHRMIMKIKILELKLGIELQVIHIPGVTMIQQGTDGLSRGVWMSPLHDLRRPRDLLGDLFSAVRLTAPLKQAFEGWSLQWPELRQLTCPLTLTTEFTDWNSDLLRGSHSIWAPSPETAAQAISAFMLAYIEQPTTTGGLFILPRILQRQWEGLSKCVHTLGCVSNHHEAADQAVAHLLPIVFLFIPPHHRILPPPSDRVDTSSHPSGFQRYRKSADYVRGLSSPTASDGATTSMPVLS